MELATMTASGQADGAMRHALPTDEFCEEGPRARETALASDSAGRIISAERRAPSAERRSHDCVRRVPGDRFRNRPTA